MKKRILLLAFVGFVVQSTFAYSWPQCQNTNGGTPEAPSGTIYIGDSKTFGHDSWGQVDGNDGKWIVVTSKNADLTTNALYGTETGTSNTQHKTANSANFNSTFKIPLNAINGVIYFLNDQINFQQNVKLLASGQVITSIRVQMFDRFGCPLLNNNPDYSFTLELH